jgi:hypothetical protein
MAVRLSALRAGNPLSPRRFLVLISVRGWVDPRFTVRLERLGQQKIQITSPSFRNKPRKKKDTSVGIATGYGLDDRGFRVRVPVGSRVFSSRLDRLRGSLTFLCTELVPGVKRQGREADNSHPASAEMKKIWIYASTSPYAFMAQCLIKHRDNFNFTMTIKGNCLGA